MEADVRTLIGAAYLIIGAFVANDHDYFHQLNHVKPVIDVVLAIVLWPLILIFGVHFHI
jgi:hypothetical protein